MNPENKKDEKTESKEGNTYKGTNGEKLLQTKDEVKPVKNDKINFSLPKDKKTKDDK